MRLARPRPTIRTRLTIAATAIMLLMLAVASVAILTIQRRALTAGVDEALRQRADNLQPIDPGATVLPGEGDPQDSFAQLLDSRGSVTAASANVRGAPPAAHPKPQGAGSHYATPRLNRPDGRYRVYIRRISTPDGTRFLVVGKNLDDVTESVRILLITLAGVSPILGLLLGALAWWLTGRTLRPVEAIRREVQGIRGGELHRRVPVPDRDDEIAELARTMNSMLERVEAASLRQQQFVDDASHELRTPLTRMVTDLEVSIAHPEQEPPAATMQRLLEETTGLQQLLLDLLYLARSSHDLLRVEEVDLDDIALSCARDVRHRTDMAVDTSGVAAARVRGDGRALTRAVSNLLENAARHARSRVAISTATVNGTCHVVIDDDGTGIAAADRHRVFERFTRLDDARSRNDGGAGLGLAIVQDIAARHGGVVTVDDAPLGGARFTFAIPTAEPPARVGGGDSGA